MFLKLQIDQGWLTRIDLWAAFEIIAKNIEFLDHFKTKSAKMYLEYNKNQWISIRVCTAGWPPLH
jgi:hypothetical protein